MTTMSDDTDKGSGYFPNATSATLTDHDLETITDALRQLRWDLI
jgi:hypothetical protein